MTEEQLGKKMAEEAKKLITDFQNASHSMAEKNPTLTHT